MEIKIGDRLIGDDHPTYFIADISANHDGELERAKMLIRMAKEAGADAAKFQNFRAPKIVRPWGERGALPARPRRERHRALLGPAEGTLAAHGRWRADHGHPAAGSPGPPHGARTPGNRPERSG